MSDLKNVYSFRKIDEYEVPSIRNLYFQEEKKLELEIYMNEC